MRMCPQNSVLSLVTHCTVCVGRNTRVERFAVILNENVSTERGDYSPGNFVMFC